MPTNQPSNAPDTIPADARDDRTAAAVLSDQDMADRPGGGGPGGTAGAVTPARGSGGAAPNAPLADAVVAGAGDAGAEARTRMADDATATERTSP